MANVEHKDLPNTELHEPKGVSGADAGAVYISDGAASGSWQDRKTPLTTTVWDDLRVSIISTDQGALNAPDMVKMLDDGAGSQGIYALHFDPNTEE